MEWYEKLVVVGIVCIFGFGLLRGCSSQSMTKSWGGSMDVSLEPNQKLMEVTWKDDSLWFLTKDMEESDTAEMYYFYEKDPLGMLEGTVKIYEKKMSQEELDEYNNQLQWSNDYYNSSNHNDNGEEVFIQYNTEKNTYSLLKPYKYGEYGELVPTN